MRIDSSKWVHLSTTYDARGKSDAKPEMRSKTDRVTISAEAREMLADDEIVRNPERLEKIEQLRHSVEAGTYRRDAREIAKRLLKG